MLKFLAAAAALLAWAGAARAQQAPRYDRAVEMHTLAHDGVQRSLGVYVPASYRADAPAPVIVALAGRFSSAQAFHALSGLAAVAEARGAILLYPEAAGAFWNDGGFEQLRRRLETPLDDTGFLAAALAELGKDHAIDSARVFLVGYDSGGAMAYRLACGGPTRFAGVAVVSALMWDYAAQACAAAPTPMLIVHGREDEYYPVSGGEVQGADIAARRLGVEATLDLWRGVNGCGARADANAGAGSVLHANCSSGAALAYVGVPRGGRDWFRDGPGYRLNRHGVDASALIDRFFFEQANFALPQGRGVRARSYFVYAPPNYDPARPTPVVVMLHGRPANATSAAYTTQWNSVAARRGFLVVYPEGIDNEWNAHFDLAHRDISLSGQRSTLPQDDVGFLESLVQDLGQDFNVDPRRAYVAGFSNGGFMTHRMACSAGDAFAAFGIVGAALYLELVDRCRRSPPTPVIMVHGTGDPSVPYDGVQVANPQGGEPIRITLSVRETVATFMRRNHCNAAGAQTQFAESGRSPGTHVIRFVPRDCQPGADVAFYLINGGGHTWPGVPGVLGEQLGPVNLDMHASEVIWDFFAAHALPETR